LLSSQDNTGQAAKAAPLFNNQRNKQTDRIASTGDRRADRSESLPTTGKTLYGCPMVKRQNRVNDPASNAPRPFRRQLDGKYH